ncbi:CPBP family intramembrane glutamic endopeptidase [Levilactobacillus yiduensis]|uniref:CPBP family intramembrane glutamic endopeptidase n=1 Tax=Levilactobacillus yiduensis TaxID=2953880 RepID=UPI000EF2E491|nr:CPBP family intramembrane glutamic endopeptidase [Levilactobacillus yiduensis]AYM03309.1 CPBP family intramembrane metalloprotease [Levilactobacillus brevis]
MSEPVSNRRLAGQFIAFWFVWLFVQIGANTPIEQHLTGWPQELALDAIKLIIWLGAAWLFIKQARPGNLSLSNAAQWRPAWRFGAGYLVWGIIVVYLLAQFWLAHHGLTVAANFKPQFWGRYFLVVGVTEEFLFRGYFLNALLQKFPLAKANVLQALAFASLHIPRYLTTVPTMSAGMWISNLLSVFILGLLFGWLYARSRSLWPGIAIHMTWDILVTLFG